MAKDSSRLTAVDQNVHHIGSPGSQHEVQIIQDKDGYSEVNLPYLGIQLNVPFGWASWGGFNTMARIDFFPDPNHKSNGNLINSPVSMGIKILNSASLAATSFQDVAKMVRSFDKSGKSVLEMDEPHHVFLMKTDVVVSRDEEIQSYSIFMQDPNPNSNAWVDIDIHAPKQDFAKYAGFIGLVYRDIKINWPALADYMRRQKQNQ
ncbi:MAG: hypothetical protein DMG65_18345 [Candidatus Angelobacter sp. Gp1-AA117]|nr:MAG: hypothetical protein DMG65_18345 [Candidatus Angelobacter sp. Gp1-AA117]